MDYNPSIWGSSGWALMHLLAEKSRHESFEYAHKLNRFYTLLGDMLPCHKCRINYKEHIKLLPIPTISKGNRFVRWVYHLHHSVNLSRGIQSSPDYHVIRDMWHQRYLTMKEPYREFDLNNFLNVLEHGRHREFWSLLDQLLPIQRLCKKDCLD